jgi:hypothetical protein
MFNQGNIKVLLKAKNFKQENIKVLPKDKGLPMKL